MKRKIFTFVITAAILTVVVPLTVACDKAGATTTQAPGITWTKLGQTPVGLDLYVACDSDRHVLLYAVKGGASGSPMTAVYVDQDRHVC